MNRATNDRLARLATVAYMMVIVWVLLGRPNLRLQLMAVGRKTLRRVATASAHAATRLGDDMIDLATDPTT